MYAAITPSSPTTWNPEDLMVLSDDSKLCVTLQPTTNPSHFTWRSKHAFTVAPSMSSPVAYFEITAKHWVTIGICRPMYPIDEARPGERPDSAVFHGGDGTLRLGQSATGQPFAAPWGEGDRIGCGVKLRTGAVFFTVNGNSIGAATFASEGSWNFCIGSHNIWDDQTVTIHLSPADWMFDPFVKVSVLKCDQCLHIEFPGCRPHRCILTNLTADASIACCQHPQCVSTLNWPFCIGCRRQGHTFRPLYIREREVRLIASTMLRLEGVSLPMRCLICSGCNAVEFPALGPKPITGEFQRNIDDFKHFGRCQLVPESVDIQLLISEAVFITERFFSTLNAIGPSIFASATPELESLVGDVDFDTIVDFEESTAWQSLSKNRVKQLSSYSALKTALRKPGYAILQLFKDWSGYCARIAPFYQFLSNGYHAIAFYRIKGDLQGMRKFVNQHNVKSYPTFLIMNSGRVINTILGADKKALMEALDDLITELVTQETSFTTEDTASETDIKMVPPILQVASQLAQPEGGLEPKRVSLPYLPPEILEQIIENLMPQDYTLLPIDLITFSLVCKNWHSISQSVLSDSVFDQCVLSPSYEVKSIWRISDLLATARILYPAYSNSITTLSLHLDLLFPNADHSSNGQLIAVEFFRLLSLSPNLNTLKLVLFQASFTGIIGVFDKFLHDLQPFYAKITTLHFETGSLQSLEELKPLNSRIVSSFKPTIYKLLLQNTQCDTRIPEAIPTPKRLKHLQCYPKDLRGSFSFKHMPDPIHCFIEGIWSPTMFTFAFDEESEYDLQQINLNLDDDGIVSEYDWQLRCRRLQTLCITGDFVDKRFLLKLALNAHKLERLVMRPVFMRASGEPAEYSHWESLNWSSMRVLDLKWCLGVDLAFLAVFINACPNLNEVRMESAVSLDCERMMFGQGFHKSDTEGSTVQWQR
ncbi:hypothetical protein BC937DRAFT_88731 [Endogone sp. FLAS-F59071]|nr:hypothetical protein BC937DRAFT_88731 [Endogone sp. FLAS-F59071]|eukprot:RUS18476.1 hypothetical protein BC937DRAFT_88731 [Endogone sp. FLAS-F59071]